MPTLCNLSLNCRRIKSRTAVLFFFLSDTSVQDSVNSCILLCMLWADWRGSHNCWIVRIFKRITPHGLQAACCSTVGHHTHPIVIKNLVHGVFSLPSASTSWLHFSATRTLAVNRAPIKSHGTIQRLERLALSFFPARALPGSCTLARRLRSKPSLQKGTDKSLPALEDVGVLPTITQMFPISWLSPRCFQRHRLWGLKKSD